MKMIKYGTLSKKEQKEASSYSTAGSDSLGL